MKTPVAGWIENVSFIPPLIRAVTPEVYAFIEGAEGMHITGLFSISAAYFPRSVIVPVPAVMMVSAFSEALNIPARYSSFAVTLFSSNGYSICGITLKEASRISLHLFPITSHTVLSVRSVTFFASGRMEETKTGNSSIFPVLIALIGILCILPHNPHSKLFPRYLYISI